jgi:hypothetical protein
LTCRSSFADDRSHVPRDHSLRSACWSGTLSTVGFALASSLITCTPMVMPSSTRSTPAGPADRYDQVQQKTVHNAYQRRQSLGDQLRRHDVRSVELDLHRARRGAPRTDGDWYVYHLGVLDEDTSCDRLSDCLAAIAEFHAEQPAHEVITVFLDLKSPLDPYAHGHGAADLDQRLEAHFAPDALLRPAHVADRCGAARTVREAVLRCGWPRLDELSGRIVVVLTGGDGCSRDDALDRYVGGGDMARERAAFIAPSLSDACTIDDYARAGHVLFLNLDVGQMDLARGARDRGLVARMWTLHDAHDWQRALSAGVNFLATDHVDLADHPWASTRTPSSRFSRIAARDPG